MNRNLITVLFACVFSLSFFACESDPPITIGVRPDKGTPTAIQIQATALNQATRAELGSDVITPKWDDGDALGIFVNYDDAFVPVGEDTGIFSRKYTLQNRDEDNEAIGIFDGEFKWQAAGMPHTFYGYYPYPADEAAAGQDATAIPVSLSATQSQDALSNEFINKNMFLVAVPHEVPAPTTFLDPKYARAADFNMKSMFSIIEFRLAEWNRNLNDETDTYAKDVVIREITLESSKSYLTIADGTVDITKALFEPEFARVKGTNMGRKVTLTVNDGTPIPRSARKSTIQQNHTTEEVNLDLAFPARIVVLPNYSQTLPDDGTRDQWTITVKAYGTHYVNPSDPTSNETVKGEFTRSKTIDGRELKAGERHAITYILQTGPNSSSEMSNEDPGPKWDGSVKEPVINHTAKTITIDLPSELAWVRNVVNGTGTEANTYAGYTMTLTQNIDLNDIPWVPIGTTDKGYQGNFDGGGNLISGFNLTVDTPTYGAGLFGTISNDSSLEKPASGFYNYIEGVRIKGSITLNNVGGPATASGNNVAALVGYAPSYFRMANCSFSGSISGSIVSGRIGGLLGSTSGASCRIDNCHNSATIDLTVNRTDQASSYIGGIFGMGNADVSNCGNTGNITINGNARIGGIVGYFAAGLADLGYIHACRNTGNISVPTGDYDVVGGVIGYHTNGRKIQACYNWGNIYVADGYTLPMSPSSHASAGGVIAMVYSQLNASVDIVACYNIGDIQTSSLMSPNTGNILGKPGTVDANGYTGKFDGMKYNYYYGAAHPFESRSELPLIGVREFSAANYPQESYEGWGRSTDNQSGRSGYYWNLYSSNSFGTQKEDFPQLWWEEIE